MIKKIFSKFDSKFAQMQKSAIGKFLIEKIFFRSKGFYSVVSTLSLVLASQLAMLKYGDKLSSKIEEQINSSEGFEKIMWHIADFFAPSGNWLIILLVSLVLIGLFWLRSKELKEESVEDGLLKPLSEKTKNILSEIRTNITYHDNTIEIDRASIVEEIINELTSKQVLIISGVGGVGKTAIVKELYEKLDKDLLFYLFKASEFDLSLINSLFHKYSLQNFIDLHKDNNEKIVVIDSAEKLLDINNPDPLKEFMTALIHNDWKIIFTTRDSYLDDLNYRFIEEFNIQPFNINIQNLSKDNLFEFSKKYSFKLPTDTKILELIRNPFYLNEYLRFYHEEDELDYLSFKNRLWDKNIKKSNPKREECFLKLALERANSGQFFVSIDCHDNSLKALLQDGILGHEKYGYFITHDIYEEWALEYFIDKEFLSRDDNRLFIDKIGNSLAVRRSFRHWMSEKLLLDNDDIKLFIEDMVENRDIESFWKDEVLISVLLSDYADIFFINFEKELLANDFELLKRVSFLLRLACKEVDNSTFERLTKDDIDKMGVTYVFTQPKGVGWESFIGYVYNSIDILHLKNINVILPILYDWNNKFHEGEITKKASSIALKYYTWINEEDFYGYDEYINQICKVVISGSFEIQDELGSVIEEICANKWKYHGDKYYKLSKMILSGVDGFLVSKNMPEYVFKLANLFWRHTPKKTTRGMYSSFDREEVETAFGIEKYGLEYSTSSAYQTPVLFLLRFHFKDTLDFILGFVNESVEKYFKSGWKYQENIKEVNICLKENVLAQYHSIALWNIYRGTSSPVMPDLMQSIHMALEKYLLEIAEVLDAKSLENWLIYLLIKTKSSSISSLVASIVLAYPDKTFNIAVILFKTEDFFHADLVRNFKDMSETRFLYGMGYGLDHSDTIHQDERLQTCEDKHRKSQLETLFLNYQLFRSSEVTEDESKHRQEILWKILDDYYEKLPPIENQTEEDKTWRMFLSRMDRRKLDIKTNMREEGVEFIFEAQLEPELKEFSEKAREDNSKSTKYTPIYLWAIYRLENNQDYKKHEEFEKNPRLALEQVKEILNIPREEKNSYLIQSSIAPDVCTVLMRDFIDKLSDEEKTFCKDIILNTAISPFNKHYQFQISDGVKSAISILPLLMQEFSDNRDDIKLIIFMLLFKDYQLLPNGDSYAKYSIIGIHKYMWNDYFDDAQSLMLGYLKLKPQYDTAIEKIVKETYEQRFEQIDEEKRLNDFIKDNEGDIEKIIYNKMTMSDIKDITDIDLYILNIAFQLLPSGVKCDTHKDIAKSIIEVFAIKILNEDRHNKIRYEVKHDFFNTFANFILQSEQNDIKVYLQPWINDFKSTEDIAEIFVQFIFTQDRVHKYDNFWYVWELFESCIVNLCQNKRGYDTNKIINAYLLAQTTHGSPIWNKGVKEWHTFKEKDTRFFKRLSKSIGHCPSVLYSISKLLNDIGTPYLNQGIGWISTIVKNNKNLLEEKLEVNTIYHIENLTRKYILQNSEKIKKEKIIKNDVLEILNFLVEHGSALGYMLRERIY